LDADYHGALGNPNTTPKARVSYIGYYYDQINRPTATVMVCYRKVKTIPAKGCIPPADLAA
jgi:hypothetical protein